MQLTLKNLRNTITPQCPRCKLALEMCCIDGDTIWFHCKHCNKKEEFLEYTVCRCSKIYPSDGFKYCLECRKEAYLVIEEA